MFLEAQQIGTIRINSLQSVAGKEVRDKRNIRDLCPESGIRERMGQPLGCHFTTILRHRYCLITIVYIYCVGPDILCI